MTEIIVSIITGALTLIGVCVTAWTSSRRTADALAAKLEQAQAVTDTKLEELTREVREHNNFARRVPVMEEQIAALDRRLDNLENK